MVISIDLATMRTGLSVKRLMPNPWIGLKKKNNPGDQVEEAITSVL